MSYSDSQISFKSSQIAFALWLLLPIIGPLSALAWLFLLPFGTRDDGARIPWVSALFKISVLYALYILVRAVVAQPDASVFEPMKDLVPLLLITGTAAWAIRRPVAFDLKRWFPFICVSLLAVLLLAVTERAVLHDRYQSQLLLGNPLNLTPLLVVPALLCTYGRFAPNRLWRWIGLLSFAAAAFVVSGVSMTRGPFMVMTILVLLRIFFILISNGEFLRKAKEAALVAFLFAITFIATLSDQSTWNRFERLINTTLQISDYVELQDERAPQIGPSIVAEDAREQNSVSERATLALAGWRAFKERPMFGYGPQLRFDAAIPYLPQRPDEHYSHLHNDFITHLVAGGVFACGLLILVLAVPLAAALGKGSNKQLRFEIGLLFSLNFVGIAAVNNVLFVWVSAFTLAISLVAALLILDWLATASEAEPSVAPA